MESKLIVLDSDKSFTRNVRPRNVVLLIDCLTSNRAVFQPYPEREEVQ